MENRLLKLIEEIKSSEDLNENEIFVIYEKGVRGFVIKNSAPAQILKIKRGHPKIVVYEGTKIFSVDENWNRIPTDYSTIAFLSKEAKKLMDKKEREEIRKLHLLKRSDETIPKEIWVKAAPGRNVAVYLERKRKVIFFFFTKDKEKILLLVRNKRGKLMKIRKEDQFFWVSKTGEIKTELPVGFVM